MCAWPSALAEATETMPSRLIQSKKTLVNMGIPPLAKKDYVHYSQREMYTIVSYVGYVKKFLPEVDAVLLQ